MQHSLVILAAGIGKRYGGIKQMEPVGPSGEFIIDYSIYDAIRAGFDKIVFVISESIEEDFKATIGSRTEKHVDVGYVLQELDGIPPQYQVPSDRKKPWGTGHAVLACRDAVNGPFAIINADDFYGRDSYEILFNFLESTATDNSKLTMVGFILHNTLPVSGCVARGISYANGNGQLSHIVERTAVERTETGARCRIGEDEWETLTGDELVSMNMWGFKPSVFPYLEHEFEIFLQKYGNDNSKEFFAPSVIDKMILEGKATVQVLKAHSRWLGITYPADREFVVAGIKDLINANEYPSDLWADPQLSEV